LIWETDSNNRKYYKYVCKTTNKLDTKSYPNPNPTTKENSVVSIQLDHMSYVSREIHTRQSYCTRFNTFRCQYHSASDLSSSEI